MDMQTSNSAALLRTLLYCNPNIAYAEVVVGSDHSSFFSLYARKAGKDVSIFVWEQEVARAYGWIARLNGEEDAMKILDLTNVSLPKFMLLQLDGSAPLPTPRPSNDEFMPSTGISASEVPSLLPDHGAASHLLWLNLCNITDTNRLIQLHDAFIALFLQHNLPAVVIQLCNYHPGSHYPTETPSPAWGRLLFLLTRLMNTITSAGFVAYSVSMQRRLSDFELHSLTEQFHMFGKDEGLTEDAHHRSKTPSSSPSSSSSSSPYWNRRAPAWGGDTLFETVAFLRPDSSPVHTREECLGKMNQTDGGFQMLRHNWQSGHFEWF